VLGVYEKHFTKTNNLFLLGNEVCLADLFHLMLAGIQFYRRERKKRGEKRGGGEEEEEKIFCLI
jgi:hypothetical protein